MTVSILSGFKDAFMDFSEDNLTLSIDQSKIKFSDIRDHTLLIKLLDSTGEETTETFLIKISDARVVKVNSKIPVILIPEEEENEP